MNIESRFKDVAIKRSGITMYKRIDALRFIEQCKKQCIPILGIEGFYLTLDSTEPSMINSVDFSSLNISPGDTHRKAREFLESREDELYFEIVYDA